MDLHDQLQPEGGADEAEPEQGGASLDGPGEGSTGVPGPPKDDVGAEGDEQTADDAEDQSDLGDVSARLTSRGCRQEHAGKQPSPRVAKRQPWGRMLAST